MPAALGAEVGTEVVKHSHEGGRKVCPAERSFLMGNGLKRLLPTGEKHICISFLWQEGGKEQSPHENINRHQCCDPGEETKGSENGSDLWSHRDPRERGLGSQHYPVYSGVDHEKTQLSSVDGRF